MSSVDNRVVNMEFNNRDFATKIADTMASLQKLDRALKFENGKTGLDNVANAANNVDFSGMEAGIQSLSNRFSTLGIIGMTAISKITGGIMDFGRRIGGKVVSGGISRAMGLEHAAFMLEGIIHNSKQEAAVMDDVKQSVDGTAYSLDQAANVAAQFVATGMRSGNELRTILKGVTGISAVFEADYNRVGQIFTQVSAQGKVYANDLMQLSSLGVNAKAALVTYYQEVKKQSDVSLASIDEMVRKGQVDFKTFGNAMAYAFGDQAKQANRTFSGAMSNVNAHLAQIGEKFVRPFIAAKESIDSTKNSTYNLVDILNSFRLVIDRVRDSLGDAGVYENWAKGVNKVSEVITKFLNVLAINPEKDVMGFVKGIESIQKALGMNDKDFKNLVDTFFGIIDAFKILKNIAVDFIDAFLPAGSSIENFGSNILEVTGSIGRFITNLRDVTDKTDFFTNSFENLGKVVSFFGDIIKSAFEAIFSVFDGAGKNATSFLTGFINVFKKIGTALSPIGKSITSVFGEIKDIIVDLFDEIGKAMSTGSTDQLIGFLKALVSGGIGLEVLSFLQNVNKLSQDVLTGFSNTDIIRKAKFLFGNLNTILKEFTVGIQLDNLLKIAKAVGILAGSLLLLSLVKPERMFGAMMALEVIIQNVSSIIKELDKITSGGNLKQAADIAAIAGALLSLSVSLVIMSAAVLLLSTIPFEKMFQGLLGIGALLGELVVFMKLLQSKVIQTTAPRIESIAKSMVVLGVALNLLAFAVRQIGSMNMEDLVKGLIGVGTLLFELAAFMYLTKKMTVDPKSMAGLIILSASILILSQALKSISKLNPERLAKGLVGLGFVLLELAGFVKIVSGSTGILSASVGMLAISAAMTIMTGVLKDLGNLSEEEIAKGLLSLAGSLLIMAGVMKLMSTFNVLSVSVGLIIAAQAITMIAAAMNTMGGMSDKEMATGLLVMADALGILAIALFAMNKSLAGAAALIIAAAAIALLVPPMIALSNIPLPGIVTALMALAGVFTILGVAGTALAPVALVIIGLSAAIALLGIGMIAAGAGILLFVSALLLVAQNIDILSEAIPKFLDGLIQNTQAIGEFGTQLLLSLMEGIANNVQRVVELGVSIVVNFINGVSSKIGDIIDAGMNLAISLINGIANGINEHGPELIAAVMNLMGSIVNFSLEGLKQIVDGIPYIGGEIANGIEGIQKEVSKFFGDGKLADETKKGAEEVADATDKGTKKAKNKAKKNLDGIPKDVTNIMKDTGMAFDELPKDVQESFKKIGDDDTLEKESGKKGKKGAKALGDEFKSNAKSSDGKSAMNKVADGIGDANLSSPATNAYDAFKNTFLGKNWWGLGTSAGSDVTGGFNSALDINSPSKVFMRSAASTYEGFHKGMVRFATRFYESGVSAAKGVTRGFQSNLKLLSDADLNSINQPTIRPVMDLSNVKMGVNSINSMFNRNQYALGIAGSIPTSGINSNRNVTFNNTIQVDGAQDPSKWVDEFVQELEVQARTYNG